MTRPGARLRSLARRVCDPSTMERLIDPVIADLQCEHAEALSHGRVWRSRWIRVRGCVAFWRVATTISTSSSARAIRDWVAAEDQVVGRAIAIALAATTVVVALIVWLPLSRASYAVSGKMAQLTLYLLPQALPLGVPMGLVVGVLGGMRGRVVTTRVRRTITALTVACSIAMLADVAWALPAGNQAFRELVVGRPLIRGANELTLGQLASRDAFQCQFRLALAFAPLALELFSLGVAAARRGTYGPVAVGFMASAIWFAYYLLLMESRWAGRIDWLPAVASGWMPNLAFGAIAVILLRQPGRAPKAATTAQAGGG